MQNNIKILQLTPAATYKPIKAFSLPSSETSTIAADSPIFWGVHSSPLLVHSQVKNTNNVTERAASTQGGFINLLDDNQGT